jgi:hypothetical protein
MSDPIASLECDGRLGAARDLTAGGADLREGPSRFSGSLERESSLQQFADVA